MFKAFKIYIQIFRDRVKVIDLVTGESASKNAERPFSSVRQVLGNFNHAYATIRITFKDLGIRPTFLDSAKIVVQQMEGTEGGLSDIEKRGLRDLAEMAGASRVYLVENETALSPNEATQIIKEGK